MVFKYKHYAVINLKPAIRLTMYTLPCPFPNPLMQKITYSQMQPGIVGEVKGKIRDRNFVEVEMCYFAHFQQLSFNYFKSFLIP